MKTVDYLVIGGGPAGSMAAIRLAEAGCKVTLLEKERDAHHKVCGEFLSREAVEYLHQIGILPQSLCALPIDSVRLSAGRHLAEAALPFRALSLSRRVLDEALLQRAGDHSCEILRGAAAERLVRDGGAWVVTLNNGASIHAQTVFLATGKHDLHGFQRGTGKHSDLVGFKLRWRLAPPRAEALRESMELFLFPSGYGGLSLVEEDAVNLCLVVQRSHLRAQGGWNAILTRLLERNRRLYFYLKEAQPLWPRPLAISPIPYGYLAAESDGLWRIGDQALSSRPLQETASPSRCILHRLPFRWLWPARALRRITKIYACS